jgi:hypothetical protein
MHLCDSWSSRTEQRKTGKNTGRLTYYAPTTALCDHLLACIFVAEKGAPNVDTEDAIEIFRGS